MGAVGVVLSLCGGSAAAGVAPGGKAPDFTLKDAAGASHALSAHAGKYVVLEWVNYTCPYVQRQYNTGNMPKLQKEYTGQDVVWLTICSSAPGEGGHMAPADIAAANAKHGHAGTAYLVDESGKVGKMYGAKTTPHMFVINPDGTVGYQGAIDSDSQKLEGAINYVAEYLDLAMEGKPAKTSTTNPYGCGIKYAD
jgi:peroxiredoxin